MKLGIDVGATTTAGVLLDGQHVLAEAERPSGYGPHALLATIEALVTLLAGSEAKPCQIGIGVPGTVDVERGELCNAVNLGIDHLELAGELRRRLGVSVAIDNDVNAAALGAFHLQQWVDGTAGTSLGYLNLGTGVACGIVEDGKVRRGARGGAGEIGHVPIEEEGVSCPCGQRGCLETVCSGPALARGWPVAQGHAAQALFVAAAAGDASALALRERMSRAVARGIQIIALTLDVETIVLGGGLARIGNPLLDVVRDELARAAANSDFLASLELAQRVQLPSWVDWAPSIGAAMMIGAPESAPAGVEHSG